MKLKRRRNKRHHSHGGHALHKNQPALMTLTERTTRFEVVIKIPDYRASTCQRLLQKEIDRHPAWFSPGLAAMMTTAVKYELKLQFKFPAEYRLKFCQSLKFNKKCRN